MQYISSFHKKTFKTLLCLVLLVLFQIGEMKERFHKHQELKRIKLKNRTSTISQMNKSNKIKNKIKAKIRKGPKPIDSKIKEESDEELKNKFERFEASPNCVVFLYLFSKEEFCNQDDIDKFLRDKKGNQTRGYQLVVGKDISALVNVFENEQTKEVVVLNENKNYNFLTFLDNYDVKILDEGKIVFFENFYYLGKPLFLKANQVIDDWTKKFMPKVRSILVGKNTLVVLKDKGKENEDDFTFGNDLPALEIDINKFSEIRIDLLEPDLVYPKIFQHCMLVFNKPFFDSEENEEPTNYCDELEGSDKDFNVKDLPLSKTDTWGSGFVGSSIAPVVFLKQGYKGPAFPLPSKFYSLKNSKLDDAIKGIYILKEGCIMLFIGNNYNSVLKVPENEISEEEDHPAFFNFCFSVDNLEKAWWGNTTIGSVIVGPNTKVIFYEDENYTSFPLTASENVPNFGKKFDNKTKIKSVKILYTNKIQLNAKDFNHQGCVMVYEKEDFNGKSSVFCEQKYQSAFDTTFSINSVKIPSGNDFIIYTSGKFLGILWSTTDSEHVTQSNPKLKNGGKFHSFAIVNPGCVYLFEECDYKGKMLKFCESISDVTKQAGKLSTYGSVLIGENTTISLHNLPNFMDSEGTKEVTTSTPIKCFKDSAAKELTTNLNSIEFRIEGKSDKKSKIFNSGSSLANFVAGVALGLLEGNDSFVGIKFKKRRSYKRKVAKLFRGAPKPVEKTPQSSVSIRDRVIGCLESQFDNKTPEAMAEKSKLTLNNDANTKISDYADAQENFFDKVLDGSFTLIRKIVNWYCNFKSEVLSKLEGFLELIGMGIDKVGDVTDKLDNTINSVNEKFGLINKKFDNKINEIIKQIKEKANITIDLSKIEDDITENLSGGLQGSISKVSEKLKSDDKKVSSNLNNESDKLKENLTQLSSPKPNKTRIMRKEVIKNHHRKQKITPLKRKFRVELKTHVWDWVHKVGKNLANIYKKVKNFLKKYIPFAKFADLIKTVIEKLKKFFLHDIFDKLTKVLTCSAIGLDKFKNILDNITANFQVLKVAIMSLASVKGILILVDFLLSQLCNLRWYRLGVNYFKLGNKMKNSKVEDEKAIQYTYYGMGVGTLLFAFSEATPFTKTALKVIDTTIDKIMGLKDKLSSKIDNIFDVTTRGAKKLIETGSKSLETGSKALETIKSIT